MLQESFIFLPGVQERTERLLWNQGILTWDHLLDASAIKGVGRARLSFWKARIRDVRALLEGSDGLLKLKRLFGSRHAWRLLKEVMDEPRFLDIETTERAHEVTVVGVADGEYYEAFVRGRNLDVSSLRRAFHGATCIITFNGSSFDLPILERAFPGCIPDVPHLDLRHICAQIGLRGGLKKIEELLNVRRAGCLRDVDGSDAILLWYQHVLGERKALEELIDYNAADVLNLKPLLEYTVPRLWKKVRHGEDILVEQRA